MTLAESRRISACSLETSEYRKYQVLGKLKKRRAQRQTNLPCCTGKAAIARCSARTVFKSHRYGFATSRSRDIPSLTMRVTIGLGPLLTYTVHRSHPLNSSELSTSLR